MTGTTSICAHCGRPILGLSTLGSAGEPYHWECTLPPHPPKSLTEPSVLINGLPYHIWLIDQRLTSLEQKIDALSARLK